MCYFCFNHDVISYLNNVTNGMPCDQHVTNIITSLPYMEPGQVVPERDDS